MLKDQTVLWLYTDAHTSTHGLIEILYTFEGFIAMRKVESRVFLNIKVRAWNFELSHNPCSRCMHGIYEYEFEWSTIQNCWSIPFKKKFLYTFCRCLCTLTSSLGYVNRFCMIANSHFCKSFVIMICLWKCLGETLLIGNLSSRVYLLVSFKHWTEFRVS